MARIDAIQVGDHTPDFAPAAQIKTALAWSRDEILLGRGAIRPKYHRLEDAVSALVDAFEDGRYAEIKEAAAAVREVAHDIAGAAKAMEAVANSLVKGCVDQLNRRPHI